ncbi:MAG TPA: hypothetical protein PK544_09175 [Spirochaetota bacterium]|nr:hypothetical protein [Spirochaetota bacterium]HPJ39248.1 hypothetical protein [Spirochaetota bacterium]HPQ52343.1 hypothetical protein [Spirochaetota bacterium]
MPFSIMFAAFSLVSGYIIGDVRVHDSIILALKIILIFNIFLGGMQWIGTGGYMYLLNRIPSVRVRLFFLLLGNNMLRIMRNNREIVRQIRSRITLTGKNRLIIARYYFQNMLFKELYSMQHSHGALVLRLGESVSCHEYERNVRPLDFILFASVAGYCAAGAMMLCL